MDLLASSGDANQFVTLLDPVVRFFQEWLGIINSHGEYTCHEMTTHYQLAAIDLPRPAIPT